MRNVKNAIRKVYEFEGLLSEALVVKTAKITLNQLRSGHATVDSETAEAVDALGGIETFLEEPLMGRKLDRALTAKGIDWLKTMLFTAKGTRRNTVHTRELSDRVFEIVQNFSHFTFDGFETDANSSWGGSYLVTPMWRVHAKDGRSFSYICTLGRFNDGYFQVFN